MNKMHYVRDFEKAYGKPLRAILLEAHAKHGTQKKMAEGLGLCVETLRTWIMYAGLKLENGRLVDNPDAGFIWPTK